VRIVVRSANDPANARTGEDAAPDKSLIGTLAALGTIKVEVYKVDLQPDKSQERPQTRRRKGPWAI